MLILENSKIIKWKNAGESPSGRMMQQGNKSSLSHQPSVFLLHCLECYIIFQEGIKEHGGHHLYSFIIISFIEKHRRKYRIFHFLHKILKRIDRGKCYTVSRQIRRGSGDVDSNDNSNIDFLSKVSLTLWVLQDNNLDGFLQTSESMNKQYLSEDKKKNMIFSCSYSFNRNDFITQYFARTWTILF